MFYIKGSVAEWSKALVLGTSLFGGVGSNPTAANYCFVFINTVSRCGVLVRLYKRKKILMKLQSTQILS